MSLNPISAEQRARDMLQRMGLAKVQNLHASDLIELANLITENQRLKNKLERFHNVGHHLQFIYQRLLNIHKEDANVDYMLKFKSIVRDLTKL